LPNTGFDALMLDILSRFIRVLVSGDAMQAEAMSTNRQVNIFYASQRYDGHYVSLILPMTEILLKSIISIFTFNAILASSLVPSRRTSADNTNTLVVLALRLAYAYAQGRHGDTRTN